MFSYVALMVGFHIPTGEIRYGGVEMIGEYLPENNTKMILELVDLANSHPDIDPDVEYIDVYGYSYLGEKTLWEVSGTEEVFGFLYHKGEEHEKSQNNIQDR